MISPKVVIVIVIPVRVQNDNRKDLSRPPIDPTIVLLIDLGESSIGALTPSSLAAQAGARHLLEVAKIP